MPIKIEKKTKFPWEKFLMEGIPKIISSSLEIFQAADHSQFTYMNIISKKGAKVTKSRSWSIAYAFLDGLTWNQYYLYITKWAPVFVALCK